MNRAERRRAARDMTHATQRIYRMLTATQKYLQPGAYFTTAELIDEVLEKTGIRLDFDDPFDMVERIEKGERQ